MFISKNALHRLQFIANFSMLRGPGSVGLAPRRGFASCLILRLEAKKKKTTTTPLHTFFSRFQLLYDPKQSPGVQFTALTENLVESLKPFPKAPTKEDFKTLAAVFGVSHKVCQGPNYGEAVENAKKRLRDHYRKPLVKQLYIRYRTNENDHDAWKGVCAVLSIDPVPKKLAKMKKAVFNRHINLVDLTNHHKTERVKVHATEVDLSTYTKQTKRYFPKKGVPEGTVLSLLLRKICRPPPKHSTRDANGRIVIPTVEPGSKGTKSS